MAPDYLLLGHFTRDVLPDGTTRPGGTSLYAALTAHRLGRRVAVVSAPAELPPGWPDAITIAFHASPSPPTFENRYTPQGRQQTLHATSTPIALTDIPAAWRAAPIVHLGPVLGETPEALITAFPGALIGVTPQGWMRTWEPVLPGASGLPPVAARPGSLRPHQRPGVEHRGCQRRRGAGCRVCTALPAGRAHSGRTGGNAFRA